MKKRVLCFGDSLTWGFNPHDCSRYDDEVRWTGQLQRLLGEEYQVIEEGQNGRTIMQDDGPKGEKNGFKYVSPCMESQNPLYAMVIMLGTNDFKARFNLTAEDIASDMDRMLTDVMAFNNIMLGGKLKVLLMAPPLVADDMHNSPYGEEFGYVAARNKSQQLVELYRELAKKHGIHFLNTAEHVSVSTTDSIHLEADQQEKLAKAVYECICKM